MPACLAALTDLPLAYLLAPAGAAAALFFAKRFYDGFMAADPGDEAMQRVAGAVRDGAYAYLRRQARVVAVCIAGLVLFLAVLGLFGLQAFWTPIGVGVAAVLSGLCGFLGMKTATNASSRTAAAARTSLNDGLRVAFRAGAVMGLCVTGFALLDISFWLLVFVAFVPAETAALPAMTAVMLSFAVGASLQALFARVGGGIYTKAADVGADLVGKVEAGIPEDDVRNPAAIADNVGDNVGDVAGMGADLYESYYGSILAAMALAASAAVGLGLLSGQAMRLIVVPPALAGLGIGCSIAAIYTVRAPAGAGFRQLLRALHGGVYLASGLFAIVSGLLLMWLVGDPVDGGVPGVSWFGLWGAILTGLAAGLLIAWGTERYTSYEHRPTQRIAEQAETGPATVIIQGVAEGMLSTWIPLLTTVVAILLAYHAAGGGDSFLLGVFGVGVAAVGMLSTLAVTLATDAYGPIADNAGGNAEMTHQPPEVRETTDMLDSLGNTTAATGKGFAIGSAALTALALLAAFVTTVQSALFAGVADPFPGFDEGASEVITYQGRGLAAVRNADGYEPALLRAEGRASEAVEQSLREQQAAGQSLIFGASQTTWLGERDAAEVRVLYQEAVTLEDGSEQLLPRAGRAEVVPMSRVTMRDLMRHYDVTLMNPRVLGGLFLGVMLVFVFCAMTMNAVGRAAAAMMRECRRQFGLMREAFRAGGMDEADVADPTRWPDSVEHDGRSYPDYATCVDISTRGALREMVLPSLLAVAVPVLTGLTLGVAGVMGLLTGTLVCGFAVAIFMANAGGAWDNAKKFVEARAADDPAGGKGSETHRATVVGDTVGDPFKDTSGPSLNILIKLVSVVSVVFAALTVRGAPALATWLGW